MIRGDAMMFSLEEKCVITTFCNFKYAGKN